MEKLHIPIAAFFLMLTALLAACGGGGSDTTTPTPTTSGAPPAPTSTLSFGVKTLQFSWDVVAEADHYHLLENPDGVSGYSEVGGSLYGTSFDHEVALYQRINATYMVTACKNEVCADSAVMSLNNHLADAIGYVKASNTGADDAFGYTLALAEDGNTLAIGAPQEASNGDPLDNSASGSGAVYVFTRVNNAWSQQAYVKASNSGAGDQFGSALSLSADGNTLVVGAPYEAGNGDSAASSGAAYVFTRVNDAWSEQAYVKASNIGVGDQFGGALSLSTDGNTLAVGASHEASTGNPANNSAANSGAVYVFTRANNTWGEQAYVKASNIGVGDQFGDALTLSADGNTLAVGAPFEASNGAPADNSAALSGAAYVFTRTNNAWSQQAYVKASNIGAGDQFGSALTLSADGNTLAVGAPFEASNGDPGDNSAAGSGASYVFTRANNAWSQEGYVKASTIGAGDQFGGALSISADGNTLAVGAPFEASNAIGINGDEIDDSATGSGAAYVFTRANTAWSQQAYVKASNTEADDQFGMALSLAANGAALAVGASEDSNATGIGGNQADNSASDSGAVYLY